eukprot:3707788-Rhodomonas_salina.1
MGARWSQSQSQSQSQKCRRQSHSQSEVRASVSLRVRVTILEPARVCHYAPGTEGCAERIKRIRRKHHDTTSYSAESTRLIRAHA